MTDGGTGVSAPAGLAERDADLGRQARAVLDANWLGHATRPSPRLYPHQWSWDSACIAIGYSSFDQGRAEAELRSLFAGQWRNGLLPHIVFTGEGSYFPGPEFWQPERSPDAPAQPKTSGIVQPPLHATAALRVYRRATDLEGAAAFLAELMPRLTAWHEYLFRERTRGDEGLAEVWHPWETGMDNSPLWDAALARISLEAEEIPDYKRVDVDVADASERPTRGDYDRYAYLVQLFRNLHYRPEEIRNATPFAVQPVLFNSLFVQANRDLAEIARILGADPEPFEAWANRTAEALNEKLWDEELALYRDHDVRSGENVDTHSSAGFAPLYAGVPSPDRAERMVKGLIDSGVRIGEGGWAVTSLPPDDPRFDPNLYWRGPVWPILNWVVYHGLVRYGFEKLAADLRAAMLELSRGGFWEHYSPTTGRGHGGEQFAWTAALVLDLLHQPQEQASKKSSKTEGRTLDG
jgi:Trehalase